MRYIHERPEWPTFQWDIAQVGRIACSYTPQTGLALGPNERPWFFYPC